MLRTDDDTEADPIAFLLAHAGEVRSDADMVFYGQPDHDSGAVTLAADETGAATPCTCHPARSPPTSPRSSSSPNSRPTNPAPDQHI